MYDHFISVTTEVCIAENYRIACSSDEVIMMTSAEYGHMTVGRCIAEEDQYLGCSNDVLPVLDKWCSGLRECSFAIPHEEVEKLNKNCLKFLIKYLQLKHTCIKGM